jgi:hypothetical protein
MISLWQLTKTKLLSMLTMTLLVSAINVTCFFMSTEPIEDEDAQHVVVKQTEAMEQSKP